MTEISYPANYLSVLGPAPTTGLLSEDVTEATAIGRVAAIERALSEARAAKRDREFRTAIREYKRARSLALQLVDSTHRIGPHLEDDGYVLPVGDGLEQSLATAGLELLEGIKGEEIGPEPPVTVDGQVPEDVGPSVHSLGFKTGEKPLANLREELSVSVERLTDGKTGQAIHDLRRIEDELANPDTDAERALAGAAALNLSTALAEEGRHEEARKAASRAESRYSAVGDGIGVAQAQHNEAVSLQRLGRGNEATSTFDAAVQTLDRTLKPAEAEASEGGGGQGSGGQGGGGEGGTEGSGTLGTLPGGVPEPIGNVDVSTAARRAPGDEGGGTSDASAPADTAITASLELAGGPLSSLEPAATRPSVDATALQFIEQQSTDRLNLRWPGDSGWGALPVGDGDDATWSVSVEAAGSVASIEWTNGDRPDTAGTLEQVLAPRVEAENLGDLVWSPTHPGGTATYLTHVYAYVVPKSLGDCYNGLGDYQRAEEYYLQAAEYSYLNRKLEATHLWIQLARNVLEWGDDRYKDGEIDAATKIYGKLIAKDGTVPGDSPLFATEKLSVPAEDAKSVIENLDSEGTPDVNHAIVEPIYDVWARWQQLNAGLGFYGASFTPVFTFEYLQQVATRLAKRAVDAERQYVNFQSRSETEEATRRELKRKAEMAEINRRVGQERVEAAAAKAEAMGHAEELAGERVSSAREELDKARTAGRYRAKAAGYVAEVSREGSGGNYSTRRMRKRARKLRRGEQLDTEEEETIGAVTYLKEKLSHEYRMTKLQNNIDELETGREVAKDRHAAARNSEQAARHRLEAAKRREEAAKDALRAFENETFTPEVWSRMAREMRRLARTYRYWAIQVAQEMQRAYNFEHDADVGVIGSDYPGVEEADGLLGADHLLRDIQSFDYREITETDQKETRIKDAVSLANEYPFKFYQFRETGQMTFETDLDEFERRHPGFYGGRIQSVELEVVGVLPAGGLSGTLRAGGISRYRTSGGDTSTRIHPVDTMALSEFDWQRDAMRYRAEPETYGLFEGHGLGTTWELDLPRRSNNFDFTLIQDIRLVVYYEAKYDEALAETVRSREPKAGELVNTKDFLVPFDFPEAWYELLEDGKTTLSIGREHLPMTQTNFAVAHLALEFVTPEGTSPAGLEVTLGPPGTDAVTATTDDDGRLAAGSDGTLSGTTGGSLVGDWTLSVSPTDSADAALRTDEGDLKPDTLKGIVFMTEYEFEWVE